MAVDPQVQRLAGDIVAKCIAKGTWGGVYVPKETARAAFPREVHGLFSDALCLLEVNDFILWHKVGTCFGLNPARSKEAIDFGIRHASSKRAALLRERAPTRITDAGGIANGERVAVEQQWEPDDSPWLEDLRAYPSRNEVDARLRDVLDQVNRVEARDVDEVASLRKGLADLQSQVHRLASDAGKWRSLEAKVTEHGESLSSIRGTWQEVEKLTAMMEDVLKADLARAKDRADEKQARQGTCPCGDPGAVMRPSWTAKGMRWFKDPDIALCSRHDVHSVAFQFPERVMRNLDRLVARMPPFTGAPFIGVGAHDHANRITAALLKAGRIDEGFVRGASIEDGPGVDEEDA